MDAHTRTELTKTLTLCETVEVSMRAYIEFPGVDADAFTLALMFNGVFPIKMCELPRERSELAAYFLGEFRSRAAMIREMLAAGRIDPSWDPTRLRPRSDPDSTQAADPKPMSGSVD